MTTIIKSCLIQQLPVPEAICDEIKSYVFYRIDETMKRNKAQKDRLVIDSINNGEFTGEDDDYWTKEFVNVILNNRNEIVYNFMLILNTINCRVCGNYRNNRVISRILCKCREHQLQYEPEEEFNLYEDEEEEEDYRNNRYYSDNDW